MRIAYICADRGIPVFGCKGSSIHVQEFVRSLLRGGADVTLFTRRLGGEFPPGLEKLSVCEIPSGIQSPPSLMPDHVLMELSALAENAGLKDALESEGPFDLVYERYSLWNFSGMEYARENGIPGLLEVNAPLIEEQARYRVLVHNELAEDVARRVFGAATAIVAVSEEVALYLEGRGVERGRINVVPNGVDPERFSSSNKPHEDRLGSKVFTVGFVGTLKPWHGLPDLIKAFEIFHSKRHDTRLLIVGDGPEKEGLVTEIKSRRLTSAVHLTGAVPAPDVPGWLACMNVAVAPYPDMPGFYFSPLKVYEYMAAGLPVVASKIGQIKELIDDGGNGILCRPGDPESLCSALDRLYNNRMLRKVLGTNARKRIVENYTWDMVVKRILDIAGFDETFENHDRNVGGIEKAGVI